MSAGRSDRRLAEARIRDRVLFDDLEEVTRALIARSSGPRDRMFALLDVASLAFHEARYDEARAKLGELHYLARHGDQP